MTVRYEVTDLDGVLAKPGWDEWLDEYISETADDIVKARAGFQLSYYHQLNAAGRLICVIATDDDKLVGVAGLTVSMSGHYDFPLCALDTFYLRKDWRKGAEGLYFFRVIKAAVKEKGAPGFVVTAKPGTALDRLCEKRGAKHLNNLWWYSE